jgi:hypothetical protein
MKLSLSLTHVLFASASQWYSPSSAETIRGRADSAVVVGYNEEVNDGRDLLFAEDFASGYDTDTEADEHVSLGRIGDTRIVGGSQVSYCIAFLY